MTIYNSGLKHAARRPHVALKRYLCGPRPFSKMEKAD